MRLRAGWPGHIVLAFLLCAGLLGCGGDADGNTAPHWRQAFDAAEDGWLLSVAGASGDRVWTVGGTPEDGRIWRYDGASWTEEDVPDDVPLLNWVHVFDDGEPVVCGNDGTILRRRDGRWVLEETPTDQDLWGVWGASDDRIWAVGGNGRQGDEATVLTRQPGGAWEQQALPDLQRPNVRAFFKVWGADADNVYIVGQRGVVLQWNGSELEEQLVGTSEDLISVWGTSPDNVVMVGGRSNGVVVRFDGRDWRAASMAPAPGLNGVWMDAPDTAWVAGNAGTLGRVDLSEMTLESDDVDTGLDLHAVFGVEAHRFSVGGNFSAPQGPYRGVAVQFEEN